MRLALIAFAIFATTASAGLIPPKSPLQAKKPATVCKPSALRAVQPIPELRYRCRPGVDEYDEAILKWPERLRALNALSAKLTTLGKPAWWQTEVDDLNTCSFKKRPGSFTEAESERFTSNYLVNLMGNRQVRLVIVPDPCYQTGYNGSILFLLSRNGATNFVSKAFDGYFSRVDNSVGFDSADLPDEQIIEIGTGNSMPPSQEKFYFSVDAKTHRIQPKKLFQDGTEFTNKIYSDMLLSDPADVGLPEDAGELIVIRDHKLAPTFSTFSEDTGGKIEANGKRFNRTIYRWTGRFYEATK